MKTALAGINEHHGYQTFYNVDLELFAVIALHSKKSLPAIGGCRCLKHASHEHAIQEALRLSQGMSDKAKAHNLPHGGGKMVVILPKEFNRRAVMLQIGKWVEQLNGAYITASDSGTNSTDMDLIAEATEFVACPKRWTDYNPSYYTALGVYNAIKAALGNLNECSILVQGVGEVGMHLLAMLNQNNVNLAISDINLEKAKAASKNFKAKIVDPKSCLFSECDLLIPCALGGILNPLSLPKIKAKYIIGAANNQFSEPVKDAQLAKALGIKVIPDYIANAGGLIHVAGLYSNKTKAETEQKIINIGHKVKAIMDTL